MRRRRLIGAIALAALFAGGLYVAEAYRNAVARSLERVSRGSLIAPSRYGRIEYAVRGSGPPLMMIHGTGGGFDQGLGFSESIVALGHRVIAPSRFGYLRSDYPADPSSENQADAFADLLDRLGIERLPVAGGSAGALSALQFAIRHPERCSGLILIVPAAYAPGGRPRASGLQLWLMEHSLRSDFLFWAALKTVPERLMAALLATDPRLVAQAAPDERRRAYRILEELMPVSRRARGLVNDARLAGNPAPADLAALDMPVLIISVDDDGFHTDDAARYLAARVPGSKLVIYPSGGHIWVGHDADLARAVDGFVRILEEGRRDGAIGRSERSDLIR